MTLQQALEEFTIINKKRFQNLEIPVLDFSSEQTQEESTKLDSDSDSQLEDDVVLNSNIDLNELVIDPENISSPVELTVEQQCYLQYQEKHRKDFEEYKNSIANKKSSTNETFDATEPLASIPLLNDYSKSKYNEIFGDNVIKIHNLESDIDHWYDSVVLANRIEGNEINYYPMAPLRL